jgi:hypothetical protein
MKANASEFGMSSSTSDIRIAILSSNGADISRRCLRTQLWVKIALAGWRELRYV